MVQLATHNLVDVSGWDPSLFTCDWAPVMQEAQTLGVDMNVSGLIYSRYINIQCEMSV